MKQPTPATFELSTSSSAPMGTIVIVDISGYTRFVQRVDHRSGVEVISRLLKAIIEVNEINLNISEIEGDAILFYRHGLPPTAKEIQRQYEMMLSAFQSEVVKLSASVPEVSSLSLKLVATYGKLVEYSLNGFEKLYGQAVIEAHRLLKNHIDSKTYLLITEELLSQHHADHCHNADVIYMCEVYDLGRICYRFLSYSSQQKTNSGKLKREVAYPFTLALNNTPSILLSRPETVTT